MSRWSTRELARLASARLEGLTYREVQDEHFPGRSVASVRSAAQTKRYKEMEELVREAPEVYDAFDTPSRFQFSEFTLDAETFASIVRSYVRAGEDMTREATARKHGLTEDQIDTICKDYGLTKDSPPVPAELFGKMDDEEIIELTLKAREQKIIDRVADSRAKHFERKYRRLMKKHQNRETVLARVDELLASKKEKFGAGKVLDLRNEDAVELGLCGDVHAPLADVHLGKLAWSKEVGSDYDTEIGADRIVDVGRWQANRILDQGGADTVYATDVGDFFHAILSETESGTALDKDTRDLKVFEAAFEAKVSQINLLRQVSEEVVVIAVPGNHDHIFQHLFSRMLKLHYRDTSDVTVKDVYGKYSGFVVGETAHLLDHGKGVNSLTGWKAKATLATVEKHSLTQDERDRVRRRIYYCGHLHSLQVDTFTEMELRRLWPLCSVDDYEVSMRYDGMPAAELFHLDSRGQIAHIDRYLVEE